MVSFTINLHLTIIAARTREEEARARPLPRSRGHFLRPHISNYVEGPVKERKESDRVFQNINSLHQLLSSFQ